jgi:hypothetical protein
LDPTLIVSATNEANLGTKHLSAKVKAIIINKISRESKEMGNASSMGPVITVVDKATKQ